jgi:outer membrane protein assembly factor BamB
VAARPNILIMFFRFALAMICCTAFAAAEIPGVDWPRFLGPLGNNTSTETDLLEKWSASGLPLVWQKDVGSGYSAPSILGSRIVLHHRLKDEEIIECFDAATGNSVWRHSNPSTFTDPFGYNNGPRCTPLLTTNLCYTFGAEGRLVCLELESGKLVWQRETAKEWTVPEPFFGVGSTPLLEGKMLIVMLGGQPNSTVVAFDSRSGKTLWENVGQTNWHGVPAIGW